MQTVKQARQKGGSVEEYYDANEAIELLKMRPTTFYRQVRLGEIPSEGVKRSLKFPKVAIDTLARLNAKGKHQPRLAFRKSTRGDLWQGYSNSIKIYNPDEIVSFERLLEWQEINPNIYRTVIENGKRAAGVTIVPMEESVILQILQNKLREEDAPLEAIKQWSDPRVSAYIPSISRDKTGDSRLDAYRGRYLLKHTLLWVRELNRQYDIKNWYAYAATPEGLKLLTDLGFTPLPNADLAAYVMEDLSSNRKVSDLLKNIDDHSFEVMVP